jgi:hypothetical protein
VHFHLFTSLFLILICTKEFVDSNQFTYENARGSPLEDIVGDNSVIEWCLNNFLVVDDDPSTCKEPSEVHLISLLFLTHPLESIDTNTQTHS